MDADKYCSRNGTPTMERAEISSPGRDGHEDRDAGHRAQVSESASATPAVAGTSAGAGRLNVIKNLAIVCASLMLNSMTISGSRNLQSSLYADNMGNVSLTFFNVGFVASCLLLPTLLQHKLGLKRSLVVTLLMSVAFSASNLYPAPYVMFAAAAVSGMAAGPLWSSKSSYLMKLGERYAALSGESAEVVNARFFGIFYMTFRSSIFFGNLLSAIIIQRPAGTRVLSDDDPDVIRSVCGAHYCYEDLDAVFGRSANASVASIYHPTSFQINLLFGVYVLCASSAVLLCACTLDPIGTDGDGSSQPLKFIDGLLATLRHLRNPKELLVMPLSLLGGVCLGYYTSDYCVGFITCSIGIDNVGYVMSAFGAVSATISALNGPLVKCVGRQAIFALSALCQAAALVGMLTWRPEAHSLTTHFILAGLWGIASASWSSQLVSFIGFVFQDERQRAAAFACNYLWMSIGTSLWHSFSLYMCLYVQIYVIAAILVVAMIGYATLELVLKAESRPEDYEL